MGWIRTLALTAIAGWLVTTGVGCGSWSSDGEPGDGGPGGATTGGVATSTGGAAITTGGSATTGGAQATGGVAPGTGGATGGTSASGGTNTAGGANANGGATTGGVAATGGTAGAPPLPDCPAMPPTAGEPCKDPPRCFYDACPGGKRTLATCNNLEWMVEEGTSCDVECSLSSTLCGEATYCRVSQGGALTAQCLPHTCGSGPVTAACTAPCPLTFSLDGGVTATCNTCPQGGCP